MALNCTMKLVKRFKSEVYEFIAARQLTKGNTKSCLQYLEFSINLHARASAWIWKGLCLNKLGRHDEALTAFRAALTIDPHHCGAHMCAGETLEKLRQFPDAIRAYKEVSLGSHGDKWPAKLRQDAEERIVSLETHLANRD